MGEPIETPLREIHRDIVSALIFSSDGKLLMGKKDPNKGGVYAYCWHIPGGGIDDGEDKITALIREVNEETGLHIDSADLVDDLGRGDSKKTLKETGEEVLCHMTFNVYKATITKPADKIPLTSTDDLVELKWFTPEELKGIELTPPSIELFKRLEMTD